MLTGQRVEVTCDPQKVTAGDLFQVSSSVTNQNSPNILNPSSTMRMNQKASRHIARFKWSAFLRVMIINERITRRSKERSMLEFDENRELSIIRREEWARDSTRRPIILHRTKQSRSMKKPWHRDRSNVHEIQRNADSTEQDTRESGESDSRQARATLSATICGNIAGFAGRDADKSHRPKVRHTAGIRILLGEEISRLYSRARACARARARALRRSFKKRAPSPPRAELVRSLDLSNPQAGRESRDAAGLFTRPQIPARTRDKFWRAAKPNHYIRQIRKPRAMRYRGRARKFPLVS